jgi:hypothetical protein
MDEERVGGEPVPNRAAGATPFTRRVHLLDSIRAGQYPGLVSADVGALAESVPLLSGEHDARFDFCM